MTAFDTRFAARAGRRLLGDTSDPDDLGRFGEWVWYRPLQGRARRIRAMVDRDPPQGIAEEQRLLSPHLIIEVYDDPTYGIDASKVDRGGDRIEVGLLRGQKPVLLPITLAPMHSDSGLLRLELG